MTDWLHIDPDLFHFLRPEWLWLFVPMLIIAGLFFFGNRGKQEWRKIIAPHLRPFVILKGNKMSSTVPLLSFVIFSSIMIISAAGPSWKKVEVPGAKSEAILLVALDLSSSMMAEDVSPNRLVRAKFKIRDLLDADPGSKVGLMAYAGTAHPVVTPCNDYKLVAYQLESLEPDVMPVPGTNLEAALKVADTICSRTAAPSTLVIFTDNINSTQATQLMEFSRTFSGRIELMTFATPQGSRIPAASGGQYFRKDGEFVVSRLEQDVLFTLQKQEGITVNSLTLDNADVEEIASLVRDNLDFREDGEESDDAWEESGFVLLWLVVLPFVLWFRKGWMIQWCLILVFVISGCNGEVKDWDDLWYTRDYQGQRAMDNADYELAAENYESLQHKGVASYKAGDYETAIQIFKQDSSAASLYNLGLAYAANGQNDLAREVLVLASEMDPDNELIRQSIQKNEDILVQIDSLRQLNPDGAMVLEEKEEPAGELNERAAKGEDEELTSDTEVDELPQDGDRITDEQETGIRKAEELERPPEDFQSQAGEAMQNVLLREISAEPSEFLRRRFKFQYEKYFISDTIPAEPW